MTRTTQQKNLKQTPEYIRPILKANSTLLSRNQKIDIEATTFIEYIIDPIFDEFHSKFPEKETCKFHLILHHALYLELVPEPYEPSFHLPLPSIKELNFFLDTLKRVSEIADIYYNIKVKKIKNGWSFEKAFADGNSIVEKIAALKAADFNEIMGNAKKQKKSAEEDTKMKIEEVLSYNEKTLQNLILDVNSGLII